MKGFARTLVGPSPIQAGALGLLLLATFWLTGCQLGERHTSSSLIGYWYPVEVNGEPTTGSRIELRLQDVDPDTLKASGYRLSIGCDDWGRFVEDHHVMLSDSLNHGKPPQAQCDARDPARLDELRQMTHEGFSVRLDPDTYTALLSTTSGRTARFAFMDLTPVD